MLRLKCVMFSSLTKLSTNVYMINSTNDSRNDQLMHV